MYDFEPSIPIDEKCMDPVIGKKIAESKGELADFERMLERFAKKAAKPRVPPRPVFVPAQAKPLYLDAGSGSEDEFGPEVNVASWHSILLYSGVRLAVYRVHRPKMVCGLSYNPCFPLVLPRSPG